MAIDQPTITIDIEDINGDHITRARWPVVPNVGETLTTVDTTYEIVVRKWGTLCRGDGAPIWNELCVTLIVKELNPAQPQ